MSGALAVLVAMVPVHFDVAAKYYYFLLFSMKHFFVFC
jgi:hypothetical protein